MRESRTTPSSRPRGEGGDLAPVIRTEKAKVTKAINIQKIKKNCSRQSYSDDFRQLNERFYHLPLCHHSAQYEFELLFQTS